MSEVNQFILTVKIHSYMEMAQGTIKMKRRFEPSVPPGTDEFLQSHIDLLKEFDIDWGILYEYPKVAKLLDSILGSRRYAEWVFRTDNGRRLVMDYLIPASEREKTKGE